MKIQVGCNTGLDERYKSDEINISLIIQQTAKTAKSKAVD
jgi:hypothetical protein